MSKIAVVYWSGTGNTEAMAKAVLEGAKEKGAEVVLLTPDEFDVSMMDSYDAIAFGCPAMGAEVLEEEDIHEDDEDEVTDPVVTEQPDERPETEEFVFDTEKEIETARKEEPSM